MTRKQRAAWEKLTDKTTTEILFGGGAGGAKSFLGCAWLIMMCCLHPGTRWLMGRAKLKNLKQTTLKTFFEICSMWGLKKDHVWAYNAQDGVIKFMNGSEILLKDLFHYPSDPNFSSLGSLEITGAFIDEANEVKVRAKNYVASRIRFKLDENGLVPKLLMSCNPDKNWVYQDFYLPWRNDTLLPHRAFVQALATDNPYISPHYIANLRRSPLAIKERLLNGNWEYDDDPAVLMDTATIMDLFTNAGKKGPKKYITVDVARMGQDKTVIKVWDGLRVIKTKVLPKNTLTELKVLVEELEKEHMVRRSCVVVDEDGVGGGLVDMLPGCKGFVNNSRPIGDTNYANLKTQCAFKFAELAEKGEIAIDVNEELRDTIIEELGYLKQKDIHKEGKITLLPKDKVKESIGRSPDFSDCLIMRMVYELRGNDVPLTVEPTGSLVGDVMRAQF